MSDEKSRPMSGTIRRRTRSSVRPTASDNSAERAIGNRLRAYYDEVAAEPVPDRFLDLLKRLDSGGSKS